MGREVLRVDNVSMKFNLSKEKIDSIKNVSVTSVSLPIFLEE